MRISSCDVKGRGVSPTPCLWHPDVSLEAAVLLYGVLGAFSVERAYCINSINSKTANHARCLVWPSTVGAQWICCARRPQAPAMRSLPEEHS